MTQFYSMYRSKDIVLQSYTKIFTKIVDPVLNGPEQGIMYNILLVTALSPTDFIFEFILMSLICTA